MRRYAPGEELLLRHLHHGRVVMALPARVLAHDDELVAWVAPGTPIVYPVGLEDGRLLPLDRWTVEERPWYGNGCVFAMPPGRAHSIVHFWNDDGSFRGWYVNLQDPLRETPRGFDTRDRQLDLWIEAGGTVTWKDEDHLEQAVELGLMTAAECLAARAEAERVLREWPFPTGWEDWRPDPAWPLPSLPADWDAA
jgi:hypothetical protein